MIQTYSKFIAPVAILGAVGIGLFAFYRQIPTAPTQPLPAQTQAVAATPDRAPEQPQSPLPVAASPQTAQVPEVAPTPLPSPSVPVQLAAPTYEATVKREHAANLRSAPSTQSLVESVVMPGEAVQVLPGTVSQNGIVWYRVLHGEKEGYIAASLLTQPLPAQQPRQYAPETQPVVQNFQSTQL